MGEQHVLQAAHHNESNSTNPCKESPTMVLGPCWKASDDLAASGSSEAGPGVLDRVRKAAGRLATALAAAEQRTDHWNNAELGAGLVDAALSECVFELAQTGCWGRPNQLPSGELWRAAEPWLQTGWLQVQARFKPRGYAGDYQLLTRLWQGTCCEHPLGRLFDRYFQSQAAVHAVRARMEQAAAALVAHALERTRSPYRALSIGSGPAFDLARAAEILPAAERPRFRFTLLDLDDEALEDARTRLSQHLETEQVACHRENLFRLPTLARAAGLVTGHDFIVCLGLFDYLADAPAAALLRLMWQGLQPGGMLLVGNFAPHHATRAFMEWFGNWYLLYRTAEQFEQLGRAAGIPGTAFHIGAERIGADLFLVARKPTTPD
jgi:hypothetical protein